MFLKQFISSSIVCVFGLVSFAQAETAISGKLDLLAGQSDRTYTHDDWKFKTSLLINENILVRYEHEVSKETNGGYDNNALTYTSDFVNLGYIHSLSEQTEIFATVGYIGVDQKNRQLGGVRVGTYIDSKIDGSTYSLGLKLEPSDNSEITVEYLKADYDTSVSNDILELIGTYYLNEHIGITGNYYTLDASNGFNSDAWKAGISWRF